MAGVGYGRGDEGGGVTQTKLLRTRYRMHCSKLLFSASISFRNNCSRVSNLGYRPNKNVSHVFHELSSTIAIILMKRKMQMPQCPNASNAPMPNAPNAPMPNGPMSNAPNGPMPQCPECPNGPDAPMAQMPQCPRCSNGLGYLRRWQFACEF